VRAPPRPPAECAPAYPPKPLLPVPRRDFLEFYFLLCLSMVLPPFSPLHPPSSLHSSHLHTVLVIMNARDRTKRAGGTLWLSERSSHERSCFTMAGRSRPSTFIPRTRLASTNSSSVNVSNPSFCINCKRGRGSEGERRGGREGEKKKRNTHNIILFYFFYLVRDSRSQVVS
jgi:hypothetical protein